MATQVIGTTQLSEQKATEQKISEQKLIRAGQRGDALAIETLYRRYQRQLFQTALRVLGNAEDAEDALQDGLLSAYRNLKRFEGRSQFSTWLTRIVINAALMKRLGAAALHQSGIDHDAREPGGKLRAAFEALEIAIGRKQAILECVFRVFGVAEDTKSGLKQLAVIAAKECFDRLGIAALAGPDQLPFGDFLFRKLRGGNHLRSHLFPHGTQ